MGRTRTGRIESDRWTRRVKIALDFDTYQQLCDLTDQQQSTLSEMGARLIKLGIERQYALNRTAYLKRSHTLGL